MGLTGLPSQALPARVSKTTFSGVLWGGFAIATLSTALRFAARYHRNGKLYLDDALVMLAWLIVLATSIAWHMISDDLYIVIGVLAGTIPFEADLIPKAERTGKVVAGLSVLFYTHLWVIKIALLVFFRRLYRGLKVFERLWYATLFFTVATGIVCIADGQYGCLVRPVAEMAKTCFSAASTRYRQVFLIVNCTLDLASDAAIIALPIYMLWGVRIAMRHKLVLGALFSVTLVTMIVAVCRVIVLLRSATFQMDASWVCLWNVIEVDAAMIVACLASFRSLFVHKDSSRDKRQEQADEAKTSEAYVRPVGRNAFAAYMADTSDLFSDRRSRPNSALYEETSSVSDVPTPDTLEPVTPKSIDWPLAKAQP